MSFELTLSKLDELRAHKRALMVDSCVVTRAGDKPDIYTGLSEQVEVYSGACQLLVVSTGGASDRTTDVQSSTVEVSNTEVHLPYGSPMVKRGDAITLTSENPYIPTRVFTVTHNRTQSISVAQKVGVEQVGEPGE